MLWNSFVFTSPTHTIQHVPDVIHHSRQLTRLNCNTTGPWTTTWNSCVSFFAVSNAFDQIQHTPPPPARTTTWNSVQHPFVQAHSRGEGCCGTVLFSPDSRSNQHVVTQQLHFTTHTHTYKRPHRTELVTVLATSCDNTLPYCNLSLDRMLSVTPQQPANYDNPHTVLEALL